tara:strand:+ start:5477 stop:5731 length:255 start_codon:yes stop_codon:yes gene_type:complete
MGFFGNHRIRVYPEYDYPMVRLNILISVYLYYAVEGGEHKGKKNDTAQGDLTCCIHKPLLTYTPLMAFFSQRFLDLYKNYVLTL